MNPSTALRTGVRLLWTRSASVLPVYLLASGLYGAARTPLVVAGGAALWLLAVGGHLNPFLNLLRDASAGGGSVDPGAVPPDRVGDVLLGLLTPGAVLLVAAGVLVSAVLAVLASAVGSAAAISGLFGLLRGDDGVESAVTGARRYWRSFVGIRLLLLAALAVVVVPFVGVVAAIVGFTASFGGVGSAFSPASILGALAALFAVLVTALVLVVVLVLFAFAEQAVVVDDVGAVAAVGRSVRLPFRRPIAVLGYVAVAAGALVFSIAAGSIAATAGAARVTGLVGTILLPPIVDGFKTALYAEASLASDAEPPAVGPRARAAFGGGLREIGGFVREHPAANLVAAGCFAGGGAAGWVATNSLGVSFPVGGDVAGVFGALPVGTFANLAANNWLVATDIAYSGVAGGVPTVVTLVFNGVIVGAIGGVFDPAAFLALVAPHGIVEIPALVIGGGAGLWLGGVGIGAARGRLTVDDVAAAIRRTYRILLGLVPLFVVAAFVEAFLTPLVASVVLGG